MLAFRTGERPQIIAHRGGSTLRPENTMVAFRHAYALGARTMELDVHLTTDEVLVVHHDDTVDRTTNGSGPISGRSWLDVRSLDAGYRFQDASGAVAFRGAGVVIPTLEEVFTSFPDCAFIVELKPTGSGIARAVRTFIDAHRVDERVCVAGFDEPTLVAYRALPGPRTRTSAGRSAITRFWAASRLGLDRAMRLPYQMLQLPVRHNGLPVIDRRLLAAARRARIEIHAWTIDDRAEMERLLALGVDAVITDAPDVYPRPEFARRA